MSGNFVIGIIVFTILVIVNFVVITKGSGRIAEVAARFHLDAMPGKQMAIDADLSRRPDRREQARAAPQGPRGRKRVLRRHGRRLEIRARRRHRRPAGGLHQHHRRHDHRHRAAGHELQRGRRAPTPCSPSATAWSRRSGADRSTAAGLSVSKAGISGAADKALLGQLSGYPSALGMSAAVMILMLLLPGIPMLPFILPAAAPAPSPL